jgi:hypothetical protein
MSGYYVAYELIKRNWAPWGKDGKHTDMQNLTAGGLSGQVTPTSLWVDCPEPAPAFSALPCSFTATRFRFFPDLRCLACVSMFVESPVPFPSFPSFPSFLWMRSEKWFPCVPMVQISWLPVYPMDVIKSRIQSRAGTANAYKGIGDAAAQMLAKVTRTCHNPLPCPLKDLSHPRLALPRALTPLPLLV